MIIICLNLRICLVNANLPNSDLTVDPSLPRPTSLQINQLRQLFLVGSPCNVARKLSVPLSGLPTTDRRRLRYAYEVCFLYKRLMNNFSHETVQSELLNVLRR